MQSVLRSRIYCPQQRDKTFATKPKCNMALWAKQYTVTHPVLILTIDDVARTVQDGKSCSIFSFRCYRFYGVRSLVSNWFQSFFTNRTQGLFSVMANSPSLHHWHQGFRKVQFRATTISTLSQRSVWQLKILIVRLFADDPLPYGVISTERIKW